MTKKWTPDFAHSEVQFKVKHLMINNVTGTFGKWDAEIESSGSDFEHAKIHFTAEVNTITTGNEMRDNHLKSDDFFNAEAFPQIKFVSTGMKKKNDDTYVLEGNLTMRNVTKPVTLNATYGGQMVDFYGNNKAGFEIEGKVKRKDFGLAWDAVTEAGGVVVSDEIRLIINIQIQEVK